MKKYAKKSADERKKEVTELMERLEEGVKSIFEDGGFKEYLKTMSKFYHYSLSNQILIWTQCPDATAVAGFSDWKKKFNRHVKKGETGIRIFAPMQVKIPKKSEDKELLPDGVMTLSDEDEGCTTVTRYRAVSVFDVSQTEGEPLPTYELKELGGNVAEYERLLNAIIGVSPCGIVFENIETNAKGFYAPLTNQIVVQEGMGQEQTIKTCLHEIAHSILHNTEERKKGKKDRPTQEVEAESIAFVVSNALGISTDSYSFGYVASWSQDKSVPELKNSLGVIRETAMELIDSIEKSLSSKEERGLVCA